uniref:F-box domain-containing protein n=1 Tax=Aegilops tauschii TaxID=37682 RepID=M8AWA6_AEGTA
MQTDVDRSVRRRLDSPDRQITSAPPAQLPDDLIHYSILARLPFRLLLRLAPVCKAWRRLILHDPVFARGRLEVLTPGAAAAAVAPPDAGLSFLPVVDAHRQHLRLCSTTSGLLLVTTGSAFWVVNPATRAFREIPYAGEGAFRACLAYDPATAHQGSYHLVVPARANMELWRFWIFSFSSLSRGWRASWATVRMPPYGGVQPKALHLGGLSYWLCNRGDVLWYNYGADAAGKLPPPPHGKKRPSSLIHGGGFMEGSRELVAWRGRIAMVSASPALLAVWALSSSPSSGNASSPARWEMVHRRSWHEIPGMAPPASRFLWSVVPAGVDVGAEEVLGLAVRIGYRQRRRVGGGGDNENVWRREVLRYDMRTDATATVAELVGREKHDDFVGFGYHSSTAPLY